MPNLFLSLSLCSSDAAARLALEQAAEEAEQVGARAGGLHLQQGGDGREQGRHCRVLCAVYGDDLHFTLIISLLHSHS